MHHMSPELLIAPGIVATIISWCVIAYVVRGVISFFGSKD